MKRIALFALSFAVTLSSAVLRADDHLVPQDRYRAQVASEAARRNADLAIVRGTLESPAVARVASRSGIDLARVQGGLSTLSDSELHDVAQRASQLHLDPTSGSEGDVNELLVIFLLVAIVILVLRVA